MFLTSVVTDDACFGGESNDIDEDGLGDLCEQRLADAFNPELRYCSCDDVAGEPTYVARAVELPGGNEIARILYMPSYHNDAGSGDNCWIWNDVAGGLPKWLPVPDLSACDGHWGDSEGIVEDVRYDYRSEHWILNGIFLSEHAGYAGYIGTTHGNFDEDEWPFGMYGSEPITDGTYPSGFAFDTIHSRIGGAPIVWVAEGKHANYRTEAECNGGGGILFWGNDDCQGDNAFMRLLLYDGNGTRNLGSSADRWRDCIPTNDPGLVPDHRPECYWRADSAFTGWSGAEPASTTYALRLTLWRF